MTCNDGTVMCVVVVDVVSVSDAPVPIADVAETEAGAKTGVTNRFRHLLQ